MAVAWERAAEGFGAFGGGQTAALNALKNRCLGHVAARGAGSCLGKGCGRRLEQFGGGQTAALNALRDG